MMSDEQMNAPPKYTYFFGEGCEGSRADGSAEMTELLGNKGAQLAEMTNMGLPVPSGFTISTEVCDHYFRNNRQLPDGLMEDVRGGISRLEQITGYRFGDAEKDPLLVSVRSGAAASMPGMMETILNVGLTDENVRAYIRRHNESEESKRFILDCQRRLYAMFGEDVFGIDKEQFKGIFEALKKEVKVTEDPQLKAHHLETLVERYKELYNRHDKALPQDPDEQLKLAIMGVEDSAAAEKAMAYLRSEGEPEKVSTAVNVQRMVFGNENTTDCATGVGFTRNPSTGVKDRNLPYGEFLFGAQGEDIVGGSRTPDKLHMLKHALPDVYNELMGYCEKLEEEKRRVQDYEFTIWKGKLYMLQTRDGKLNGRASVRSSLDMVQEGLIEERDAILRVTPRDLEQLLHKMVDYEKMDREGAAIDDYLMNRDGSGIPASPGAGVGMVVFDCETVLEYHARNQPVILARKETQTSDIEAMDKSEGIVTSHGGETSHAALVARNKGVPCVPGTQLDIDVQQREIRYVNARRETVTVREGEMLTVDGSNAKVFRYEAPLIEPDPDDTDLQDLLKMVKPVSKMRVYANANDADEAKNALRFGAEGIGLARTEYMFTEDKKKGENRALTIQSWVLSKDNEIKEQALQKLEQMQRDDFLKMYEVMRAKPLIIRLLDYPLHELLSDAKKHLAELSAMTGINSSELEKVIDNYTEVDPMLGHRSVRLGITHPALYRRQARAVFSAAKDFNDNTDSDYVTPRIEIPLVSLPSEVKHVAEIVHEEAEKFDFIRGGMSSKDQYQYRLGIMYELAGACFNAAELAAVSEFGSFGTNDLTQTVMGISREDSASFMLPYIQKGIVSEDPFVEIDSEGSVARAMAHATMMARSVKHDYHLGICGDHAGNPASLKVSHGIGLRNVSPGPNQVPIAWLCGAQLSLTQEYGGMLRDYYERLDIPLSFTPTAPHK